MSLRVCLLYSFEDLKTYIYPILFTNFRSQNADWRVGYLDLNDIFEEIWVYKANNFFHGVSGYIDQISIYWLGFKNEWTKIQKIPEFIASIHQKMRFDIFFYFVTVLVLEMK